MRSAFEHHRCHRPGDLDYQIGTTQCVTARRRALVDTGQVTTAALTASPLPRTGPAVREALGPWPADRQRFEAELTQAAQTVDETFDLAPAQAVIEHWHRVAVARSQPLTPDEQDLVGRAQRGDYTGLYTQTAAGGFDRIE